MAAARFTIVAAIFASSSAPAWACDVTPDKFMTASRVEQMYSSDVSGRRFPDWIHIAWNGPQTHPMPLIWFSRHQLKRTCWPERNVVLSKSEIKRLLDVPVLVPDERVGVPLLGRGYPTDFRISVRRGFSKPIVYRLNSRRGCRYLRSLLKLRDIPWTEDNLEPFDYYDGQCRYVKVPFR